MDFTFSLSSDWFNIVSFPLIFWTLKDVLPKWNSIWDSHLSSDDRRLLMRIVIFLALPAVVFIHESGHLLAALSVGAKVYAFHYGPVTGHVDVDGNIEPWKLLWIAVAGNLAQVMVGVIALILAVIVRSAPLVAFLVYLGLFAIGDTVIFYAALSLASVYGDWKNIYQSPCTNLVTYVAAVHAILVVFVLYCVNGSAPRLWFTRKTMPGWSAEHEALAEAVSVDPSISNLMALVASFMQAGLYKEADTYLKQANAADVGNPGIAYAKAELEMARGRIDKGLHLFESLAHDERISDKLRAQIVLQMGEIWLDRRDSKKSLEFFEAAANIDPEQGDARLQRAILKTKMTNYDELEDDLAVLHNPNTTWIYRNNQQNAAREIEKLEGLSSRQKQERRS